MKDAQLLGDDLAHRATECLVLFAKGTAVLLLGVVNGVFVSDQIVWPGELGVAWLICTWVDSHTTMQA